MPYSHFVKPGSVIDLSKIDSRADGGLTKDEGLARAASLGEELRELQDLLFAAGEKSCLIVLQGMDTSGKDGTIRYFAKYVNIQGCRVASFKQPSQEDLSHDFLWRIHSQTPSNGQMTIFNRSHYEDVLVVRVHKLVPKDVWEKRFDQINRFEKHLSENGTVIIKFFLHISKKEQEERLLEREQDRTKAWKLAVGDWKERELWDKYQEAYADAISRCSTEWAPWRVVPAGRKWYRDLAVVEAAVEALKPFRSQWLAKLDLIGSSALKDILSYRVSNNIEL